MITISIIQVLLEQRHERRWYGSGFSIRRGFGGSGTGRDLAVWREHCDAGPYPAASQKFQLTLSSWRETVAFQQLHATYSGRHDSSTFPVRGWHEISRFS